MHPGSNRGLLYSELQFPVTSNFGSMKKKSHHRHSAHSSNTNSTNHTGSTTVLSMGMGSAVGSDPSPHHSSDDSQNSTIPISQSMDDNMHHAHHLGTSSTMHHRYVPDFVAINARKTAV